MSEKLAEKLADIVPLEPKEYEAFCKIDRKYFVPAGFEKKAYEITPLPLADDSTISSPLTIAKMTHYLNLDGVDSVLEIGCGSGYQAAILSKIVRRVLTNTVKRYFKAPDYKELNIFEAEDGLIAMEQMKKEKKLLKR